MKNNEKYRQKYIILPIFILFVKKDFYLLIFLD